MKRQATQNSFPLLTLTFTLVLLLVNFSFYRVVAQSEFQQRENGLIYTDAAISQLKKIVDSVNLKFKICNDAKIYLSKQQSKAHYILLKGASAKSAKIDIEAGIEFSAFVKKHHKAEIENDLLIVRSFGKSYQGTVQVEFLSLELAGKYGHQFYFTKELEKYQSPLAGKWVFNYYAGREAQEQSIEAFYIAREFEPIKIPVSYTKMVQYADCLIDTNTQIYKPNAQTSGFVELLKNRQKIDAFLKYINEQTNRPSYRADDEQYHQKYSAWEASKRQKMEQLQKVDPKFDQLFKEAIAEVGAQPANGEFEQYVKWFHSKEFALEMMRNRKVFGRCSMDDEPRIHALNIAQLSAETAKWEIFLRAHLDLMNDNFERMSDGSYAFERRSTYIRELEVLDINVLDLLLGISLRIENTSEGHYLGNIARLGRSLSETEHPAVAEEKMLQMIQDQKLDDYNRMVIYYLFLNYNHHLREENRKSQNTIRLSTAIGTLPTYLSAKLTAKNQNK